MLLQRIERCAQFEHAQDRRDALYGERKYNSAKLDKEVAALMADKEVQRHGGIYEFLLSDRTLFEKLNLWAFEGRRRASISRGIFDIISP